MCRSAGYPDLRRRGSVDFRDPNHGILGGGDVVASTVPQNNERGRSDDGQTWTLATPTPFIGAVYGLTYVPSLRLTVVATGPSGAAWSSNEGNSWSLLPGVSNCWTVAFATWGPGGWAVAAEMLKIDFSHGTAADS